MITVAAVALPTLNCLQRGQVSILALYLLLLGLRLVLGGRNDWARVAGGILLALPVAVKIVPLLPVATFVFVQLVGYPGTGGNGNPSRRKSAADWPARPWA